MAHLAHKKVSNRFRDEQPERKRIKVEKEPGVERPQTRSETKHRIMIENLPDDIQSLRKDGILVRVKDLNAFDTYYKMDGTEMKEFKFIKEYEKSYRFQEVGETLRLSMA